MTVTERGGQNPPLRRRKLIDLSDGTGQTGDLDAGEYYLRQSKALGNRLEQQIADRLLVRIPLLREFITRGIFEDLPRPNDTQQALEGAPVDAAEHVGTVLPRGTEMN